MNSSFPFFQVYFKLSLEVTLPLFSFSAYQNYLLVFYNKILLHFPFHMWFIIFGQKINVSGKDQIIFKSNLQLGQKPFWIFSDLDSNHTDVSGITVYCVPLRYSPPPLAKYILYTIYKIYIV